MKRLAELSIWKLLLRNKTRLTDIALMLQNDGILVKILPYLDDSDLKRYRLVSRRWNRVINQYTTNKSDISERETSSNTRSKEVVKEARKTVKKKSVPVLKKKSDLLSGCSCLSLILSFVSKSDILKFKFINRRFCTVIRQNKLQLVRYPTIGELNVSTNAQHDVEYVGLSVWNMVEISLEQKRRVGCSIYVTHQCLLIGKCRWMRSIEEYVRENATLIEDSAQLAQQVFYWQPYLADHVGYKVGSMEEGLATVMYAFLRTYYLEKLYMIDQESPLSSACLSAISNAFTRANSTCDLLQTHHVLPCTSQFYKLLGCRVVCLADDSIVSRVVPLITEFHCDIEIYAYSRQFDSWKPYADLIKKWSESRLRIEYLEMRPSDYPGERHPYKRTALELMRCLQGLDCFSITYLQYLDDCDDKELIILIGRDTDNVVLRLSYAREYCLLTMQDYVMYRRRENK